MKLKRLVLALAIGTAGLQFPATQAATAIGTFDVNITLNSTCSLGSITPLSFTYTSLGGAQASTGGVFSITCTSTLPYSFGLVAGTPGSPGAGTTPISVLDNVVNLTYTLDAPASGAGNGSPQSKTIIGGITAGQAGTCSSASCTNGLATNKTQTLVVTF